MPDLVTVPTPVFVATLVATLVPFVTAMLVRLEAPPAVKATVATGLSVLDAVLISWKAAYDAGVQLDGRTVLLAFLGALTWQRVVHAQVNVPYRIRERLFPGVGIR